MSNKKATPSLLMTVALIIAIIFTLIFCLFIGVYLNIPSNLGQVLTDPCGRYTSDFLFGFSICVLVFIFIAFVFRNQNKLLLAIIMIPSLLLGFYLFSEGIVADDNISSYGYLARDCHIFGN